MRLLPLIVLAAAALGCGRSERPPPAVTSTDTSPPPGDQSALLEGRWEITPVAAGGPFLAVAIDSVTNDAFSGRVTWAMAGNVAEGPARFRRFRGEITADTLATITIYDKVLASPTYEISFVIREDTWELLTYRWGGENMLTPGRRWEAKRITR